MPAVKVDVDVTKYVALGWNILLDLGGLSFLFLSVQIDLNLLPLSRFFLTSIVVAYMRILLIRNWKTTCCCWIWLCVFYFLCEVDSNLTPSELSITNGHKSIVCCSYWSCFSCCFHYRLWSVHDLQNGRHFISVTPHGASELLYFSEEVYQAELPPQCHKQHYPRQYRMDSRFTLDFSTYPILSSRRMIFITIKTSYGAPEISATVCLARSMFFVLVWTIISYWRSRFAIGALQPGTFQLAIGRPVFNLHILHCIFQLQSLTRIYLSLTWAVHDQFHDQSRSRLIFNFIILPSASPSDYPVIILGPRPATFLSRLELWK